MSADDDDGEDDYELDQQEEAEDGVTPDGQLSVPLASHHGVHPMVPYGEQAYKLEFRGREFLVKESDLDLIDLSPHERRPWRNDGITDVSVAVHRGFMRRVGKDEQWQYIPYNPANLGFYDASRNRQISATYEIDQSKVHIIGKLWREHQNLVKQWYKVDTLISEDRDLDAWAIRYKKRMHPLIRMWYRVKKATDRLEAIADRNPDDSMAAKRMADMSAKTIDVAMRIESMIHTTGKYLDAILERRIKERLKEKGGGTHRLIDAEAEVLDPDKVRLVDVNREIARIREEFTGDIDDSVDAEKDEVGDEKPHP